MGITNDLSCEVSRKFTLNGPYRFVLEPGGWYFFDKEHPNETEEMMVKMRWLSHFCELIAASYSNNGDAIHINLASEIEELANLLFKNYEPLFAAGINVTDYEFYYNDSVLEKLLSRPIVNGFFNAGPAETTPGLPDGWWYNFPGHAVKYFPLYKVVVDYDAFVRIGFYALGDENNERPSNWIDIDERGNYAYLHKLFPVYAKELIQVCEFVIEQYQI